MNRLILSFFVLSLSSCQVYRSQFDCPPGKGVPCTPVTDIEKMIVETPEREVDIFTGYLPKENCGQGCCVPPQLMKVWIADKMDPSGILIEGHYIYLKKQENHYD